MAKNLKDLRKEAGFKSGREFADELGINQATYRRYEQQPDGIPLKQAWAIADRLGCSIDMVVGREPVSVEDMRGSVQKFYDGLSDSMRERVNEYLEFIRHLQEKEITRRKEQAEAEQVERVQIIERMFFSEMLENERTKEEFLFWGRDRTRREFETYIRSHLSTITESTRKDMFARIDFGIREELGLFEVGDDGNLRVVESDDPTREEAIKSAIDEATNEQMQKYESEVIQGIMVIYDRLHPQQQSWPESQYLTVEYNEKIRK